MQTDVGRVGLYASEFTRAPPVNAPAWTGPGGRAASYLPFGGGEPYAYPRFEVLAAAHGRGSTERHTKASSPPSLSLERTLNGLTSVLAARSPAWFWW